MNAISNGVFSVVFLWIVAVKDGEGADLESRCPRILTYEEQIEEDRWRAVLELKNREGSEGIWLNVALDTKADALINTFGPSTTLNNQNFQINNPEYTLLPGASLKIRFTVKYNKDEVPPIVTSIKLNGVEICDSSGGTNNAITEAVIDTNNRKNAPTQRPFVPASTGKTLININKFSECGLKTQAKPLVWDGVKAEHWPWHIAIMILRSSKYDYHCGGTLVSTKSILTAAHCVTVLGSNKLIDSDRFILYLGITHLSDPGPYFKVRLVRRVVVHNEYNPSRYHNDLAVMEISEPVEFNDYIKPVCLWDGDVQIANLVGKFGTIVGWGIDNSNQTTADLMEAQMPVVALDVCLYHDPNFFAQFTSPKTFCAGGPNGTAVCSGDSGGGMVFPRPGTLGAKEIWYLRGVVSVSPRDGQSVCNTKSYSVFSDVAQHINWVKRTAGIK